MHLSFTRQLCKKYFFDTKILFKNASKKKSVLHKQNGFFMVGVAGLEPAASWSRTKHTSKLCHTPIALSLYRMVERLSRFGSDFCRIFSKKRSRAQCPLHFSPFFLIPAVAASSKAQPLCRFSATAFAPRPLTAACSITPPCARSISCHFR